MDTLIDESAHDIGDKVYVASIIERYAHPPTYDSYNYGLEECPLCSSEDTCYISPRFEPHGYYCFNCYLLWEWILAPE
jgi:hypothetical protein